MVEDLNRKPLAERVRHVIEASEARSERAFALKAGVSLGALRGILAGSSPTVDNLVAIARAGRVSVDWLATGENTTIAAISLDPSGFAERREAMNSAMRRAVEDLPAKTQKLVLSKVLEAADLGSLEPGDVDTFPSVPRYDVALSAGHGSFIERADLLDSIPFTAEFFSRRLGRGPKGLAIVDARGDSMEPTISDRDLVMIDTTDTRLTPAIWAFTLDDAVLVKRLSPTPGGLEVVSDNPLYGRQQLDAAQAGQISLIGRVVWVGRVL